MSSSPHTSQDTICAIATPPGVGGIGVVRVSGPAVHSIAETVLGRIPAPRQATLAGFHGEDGEIIDQGIALLFPGPDSFTGEDVLELQGHGGAVVQQMVLTAVLAHGARLAHAGEFTERAFLNDKIDLAQAEAIADLIESHTETAARAARRSLQGVLSERVGALQDQLTGLRVFIEAALDFPDEEIDFIADSDVVRRLETLLEDMDALYREAHRGQLLRDGISMTITGLPNAGKSSLLNCLVGRDAAIVTEVPGTTRDLLREYISLQGLPVHVIDTAGIRDAGDAVEVEGVRRARAALRTADIALLVIDTTQPVAPQEALQEEISAGQICIRVFNKIDLSGDPPGFDEDARTVHLSATTGEGLDQLAALVRTVVGAGEPGEGSFSARTRHLDVLRRTKDHVETGLRRLQDQAAAEMLAEELRLAQRALGEITGEVLPDDLLGAIFSSFCIGK